MNTRTVSLTVVIPYRMADRVNKFADEKGIKRAVALRYLIHQGLEKEKV